MLFCQLGRAHSLREICGGLRSSEGKLRHLGITAPNRSTLAYANEHRPWQLYRAVFEALLVLSQISVGGFLPPLHRFAVIEVQEPAEPPPPRHRPVRDNLLRLFVKSCG